MSLSVNSKHERKQELLAGIHLVIVSDVKLLKKSDGTPVESDGNNFITVKFTNGDNKSIEQNYPVGTEKQRAFDLLILNLGLDNTKQINKKEAIGKRIWIAVKEVYLLNNEITLKDENGIDIKEFYVFKTVKYDGDNSYPIINGDPKKYNGIAQEEFVDYRLVDDIFTKEDTRSEDKPSF